MTLEERTVMKNHGAYWMNLMHEGYVVVFGPVFDPKDSYGIGVIEFESDETSGKYPEKRPGQRIKHIRIVFDESHPA